jgi:hypothetical protein
MCCFFLFFFVQAMRMRVLRCMVYGYNFGLKHYIKELMELIKRSPSAVAELNGAIGPCKLKHLKL